MKKTVICLLAAAVLCVGQAPVVRAESIQPTVKPVLISELQTGGAHDATEEFVELYNPNPTAVDVTGWQLQYRAASSTSQQTWPNSSTKATLACPAGSPANCIVQIAPLGRLVLVHTLANIVDALPMAGGFSATGGQVRLLQPGATPIVQDFIGYGTAADSEGSPSAAPSPGASVKRVLDVDGNIIDTNNNVLDFVTGCGDPSPGVADGTPLPYLTGCTASQTTPTDSPSNDPPTNTDPTPPTDQPADQTPTPLTYLPMLITEVFPDPATPQQDNLDEFVEIYNPNDTAVSLAGYTIQTGSDWRYHYTLGDTPLGPHDYFAVRSAVSKLSLSNSGSGVRLIDPNGDIASETPTYGDAKEGQAWIFDTGTWQWTLTPTPYAPNILTVPVPKAALTTGTVPHKTAPKAKTSPKAPLKVAAPKLPKASKAAASVPHTSGQAVSTPTPQYWLLLPIGLIAGGYAAYEYRGDINKAGQKVWARLRGKKSAQRLLGDNSKDFVEAGDT